MAFFFPPSDLFITRAWNGFRLVFRRASTVAGSSLQTRFRLWAALASQMGPIIVVLFLLCALGSPTRLSLPRFPAIEEVSDRGDKATVARDEPDVTSHEKTTWRSNVIATRRFYRASRSPRAGRTPSLSAC